MASFRPSRNPSRVSASVFGSDQPEKMSEVGWQGFRRYSDGMSPTCHPLVAVFTTVGRNLQNELKRGPMH